MIIDEDGAALCFRRAKPRSFAEAARLLNLSRHRLIKILTTAANGGLDSLISTKWTQGRVKNNQRFAEE